MFVGTLISYGMYSILTHVFHLKIKVSVQQEIILVILDKHIPKHELQIIK